ncbi:Ig-like domain-containing protein [Massilistercora timonensis]|uniref:Ig-like domain-containing protein n=1 Tax=Massilistercora timonensis TaxID=2086584 RepID=UPI003AB431D3
MGMRSMKKMFSFILSFVMVASICFAAVPQKVEAAGDSLVFTVSADKEVVKRGDQVTVTIEMSGNKTDGYTLSYRLNYDNTKLEYIDSELGSVAEGAVVSSATGTNQRVNVVVAKPEVLSNGTLVTVTFKVKDNAPTGKIEFTSEPKVSDEYGVNEVSSTVADNTNLSVEVPATDISLNKTSTTIAKGETEKLTATLKPEDASSAITWSSANEKVATVSEDGTVKAVGAGTTKITATANGHSASCEVTVNVPLKEITVTGEGKRDTIKKGETLQLTAERVPEDTTETGTIQWSSSNEKIATVDQAGLVTAIADGTATITAQIGEIKGEYEITVQEVNLTGISIKESTTIHRGESETLTVTYVPENTTDDRTVTWESSDLSVATVDGSGTVTAVGIGSAKITAKVGNHTDVCAVAVDAPLENIDVQGTLELMKNQTAVIGYKLVPSDTTDKEPVTFTSSDQTVATVDADGNVKALKAGTTVITLKGANDVTATVTVTVTEIPIDTVSLDKKSAIVEKNEAIELMAVIGPDTTTDDDKTIKWSSDNPSVATVSSEKTNSGDKVTVTATDKGGTATITAEAWNGTKAECVVTVPVHIEKVTLPQTVTLNRGRTTVLDVVCDPEENDDTIISVEWTSSVPDVAAVYGDGTVEGLKEGTAEITAKVKVITLTNETKEYTAQTQVTVKENHLEADLGGKLAFEDMEEALLKGQSVDMYYQLNLEDIMSDHEITDGVLIEWTSSDETVASIDQTGRLSALKEGKTTVKAVVVAKDGSGNTYGPYNVEVEVEVQEIPLDSIAFDKIIKEMQVGAKDVLHVIYNPQNTTDDRDVIWNSSDASVLTVDKNGNLTALKAGKATITATVGEKEISCEITVKAVDTGKPGQSDGSDSAGNETGVAKGDESGVRTGDPAMIILYVTLFVGAMATIVLIRRRNRRVR